MQDLPTVTLPARQLMEISYPAGLRILCTAGSLWLTLDHDVRDFVLQAGDSFEADAPRRLLVYAFEPATFALSHTSLTFSLSLWERVGVRARGAATAPALSV